MKPKIAIIGRGNVGGALRSGLHRVGYEVRAAGRAPDEVRAVARWGEVIILAVPFGAIDDALREMGEAVNGKTLVDVTNVLTPDYRLALGCTTSGAEELQKRVSHARVVKAFNSTFAKNMGTGQVKGEALTLFVAGDDPGAKRQVIALGADLGFDPVDAGPLQNARWLETLGYFAIQLGFSIGMGSDIGFRLVH